MKFSDLAKPKSPTESLQEKELALELQIKQLQEQALALSKQLSDTKAERKKIEPFTVTVDSLSNNRILLLADKHDKLLELFRRTPGRYYDGLNRNYIPLEQWTTFVKGLAQLQVKLEYTNGVGEAIANELNKARAKIYLHENKKLILIEILRGEDWLARQLQGIKKSGNHYQINVGEAWQLGEKLLKESNIDWDEAVKSLIISTAEKREALDKIATLEDIELPDIAEELDKWPIKVRPFQRVGVKFGELVDYRFILGDQMGLGKQITDDTQVLTYLGWKLAKDITLEDKLIGADGKPKDILGIYPNPEGELDIFQVNLSDGTFVNCDSRHLWGVFHRNDLKRHKRMRVLSTQDLIESKLWSLNGQNGPAMNWFLPKQSAVELEAKKVEIDPYLYGLLLGDGHISKHRVRFYTKDKELEEAWPKAWVKTIYRYGNKGADAIELSLPIKLEQVYAQNKFIADEYKNNSIQARRAVLQGLMDTDGTITKGRIRFCSTSQRLATDVAELCRSLGYWATVGTPFQTTVDDIDGRRLTGTWTYIVSISGVQDAHEVFKLTRKSTQKVGTGKKYLKGISSIVKLPHKSAYFRCFEVDSEDHLYIVQGYNLTHNTIQAIMCSIRLKKELGKCRTLVIPPAGLKVNWTREINRFTGQSPLVLYGENPSKFLISELLAFKHEYTIINYDILSTKVKHSVPITTASGQTLQTQAQWIFPWIEILNALQFDLIVFDEAHYTKNVGSNRSLAARMLKAKRVIFMTGTPVMNRPSELWPMLTVIDPDRFPSYENFIWTHGDKYPTNVKMLRDSLKNILIRRRKKDVMKDLPPINRVYEWHELSEGGQVLYKKAKQGLYIQLAAWNPAMPGSEQAITNLLTEIMRLKQICAMDKVEAIADSALELSDSDSEGTGKVLIFSQFVPVVNEITKRLGHEAIAYTGECDKDERVKIYDKFLADRTLKFFVATWQTAGEGLNLQCANNVVFADLFWTPANHQQCEERAYGRLADPHPINSYYLICADTIETWIQELLAAKLQVIEQTVEGLDVDRSASIANDLLKRLKKELSP